MRPTSILRCPTLMAAVVACSGCSHMGNWTRNGFKVGPDYFKPAAPIADDWIESYDERVRQEIPAQEDWWQVFGDPTLDRLVSTVYEQNLTLQAAGLRVLEARALRGVAIGGLFPQSQAGFGSYTHTQISKNAFLPIAGGGGLPALGIPRSFDLWSTGFDMMWEFDVWGKFRRNIEAADADLDSSIENYDDILVTLLAESAASYVEYRTAEARLDFATKNVKAQQGSLDIATSRFNNGAVSKLDVTQAQTNLQNTKVLIPLFENEMRLASNKLCVLLGIPPQDLSAYLGVGSIPEPPATVAVGVPANLLRRRPDVRRAEREVAAQSARIGVATADLFPHFSFTGAINVDSLNLSSLFEQASLAGATVPGFRWDVLNYGRLVNNIRVQDARFQQLAVQYQQTVLDANAEAENAIISFLKSQQRLKESLGAVAAAQESVNLSLTQYREGATDFNRVFTLQSALVRQQDSLALVAGELATALIAVYKAMGGGWEIRYGYGSAANLMVSDGEPVEPEEGSTEIGPPPTTNGPTPAEPPSTESEDDQSAAG